MSRNNDEDARRQFEIEQRRQGMARRGSRLARPAPTPPPPKNVVVENPDESKQIGKRDIPEFKKGGQVKKTGLAKVHKGELVIPANRVKAVEKAVKKAGLKPLKK